MVIKVQTQGSCKIIVQTHGLCKTSIVIIEQTQGSCNFNLTSTGKGYIGKLFECVYH